tara:strand:+ start:224 stop:790 length:567 start_codon:yes stop_codon:yes gene_type:complete
MAITLNGTTGIANVDGSAASPAFRNTDANSGVAGSADQVIISTAGTERLRLASAGQLGVAGANYGTDGQVLTSTGASSAPAWETTPGGVKAWINFNGQGTISIAASYNVASITDNGTGDYTITFTNNMSDANYAIAGACKEDVGGGRGQIFMAAYRHAPVVGSLRVNSIQSDNGDLFDAYNIYVVVIR